MEQPSAWSVEFYLDARGRSPVEEYINGLSEDERANIRVAIRLLGKWGIALAMPHVKPIKGHRGLWELRASAHRVFYFAHTGRRFILLHAFRKKSQKTPQQEIDMAERRRDDFLERE